MHYNAPLRSLTTTRYNTTIHYIHYNTVVCCNTEDTITIRYNTIVNTLQSTTIWLFQAEAGSRSVCLNENLIVPEFFQFVCPLFLHNQAFMSKYILYPCSTKTREVLGNPSPTAARFPEGEVRGKSWGRRGWISQYLQSFGGVRTFSQHQFFSTGSGSGNPSLWTGKDWQC